MPIVAEEEGTRSPEEAKRGGKRKEKGSCQDAESSAARGVPEIHNSGARSRYLSSQPVFALYCLLSPLCGGLTSAPISVLLQVEGGEQVLSALQAANYSCVIENQAVPCSITWRRKTVPSQVCKPNLHVLALFFLCYLHFLVVVFSKHPLILSCFRGLSGSTGWRE